MLQKLSTFAGIQGPVITIVMDGYGLPKTDVGSAIAAAKKPTLDRLFANYPNIRLRAHGTAVGMPSDDDMGNSEVGHNAIGAGQVYAQGAALVANAIAEQNCNIQNVSTDGEQGTYTSLNITVQVTHRLHLAKVVRGVRNIPEVVRITRLKADQKAG